MYYIILPDGQRYGPADARDLSRWAGEDRVTPDTVLEDAASGERMPASSVAEIAFPAAVTAGPGGVGAVESPPMTQTWVHSGSQSPGSLQAHSSTMVGSPINPAYTSGLWGGRLNRWPYFGCSVLIYIVVRLISTFCAEFTNHAGLAGAGSTYYLLMVLIVSEICTAALTVKRLHDLNRPSWHFWLLLVPFYGIYLSLLLTFGRGTVGPNAWGTDRLQPNYQS